ncbi:MAG: hypothetical protein GY847_28935 [Proteobacteria bacterium]|nr:hypothetical protein [Pseudomonadota bacterium]
MNKLDTYDKIGLALATIICMFWLTVSGCGLLQKGDGIKNIIDKSKQVAACQQVAANCIVAAQHINDSQTIEQAANLFNNCRRDWEANDCQEVMNEFEKAARRLNK